MCGGMYEDELKDAYSTQFSPKNKTSDSPPNKRNDGVSGKDKSEDRSINARVEEKNQDQKVKEYVYPGGDCQV